MNKKILIMFAVISGVLLSVSGLMQQGDKKEPMVMSLSPSMPEMSLDDIIKDADVIAIGEVLEKKPAQWKEPNGKKLKDATPEDIAHAGGLFIDSVISITQILKGDYKKPKIRIRSFIGKTNEVEWVNDLEVSYQEGQSYLLFLNENYGPSNDVEPGSYISVNAFQGVYIIENEKALAINDEWILKDLVSHIQEVLLSQPLIYIPDSPEAKEIMKRVEFAYDIESEAAATFDISKFPLVFINDPRYSVNADSLEFMKMVLEAPMLESSGYLDYKNVHYGWWKEGFFRWFSLREKAIVENRNVSNEEINAFLASKWGDIPGHIEDPKRRFKIKFLSVNIENDVATVVFNTKQKENELYLVLMNGQWFVAGNKDISAPVESIVTETPLPTEIPTEPVATETPLVEETSTPAP